MAIQQGRKITGQFFGSSGNHKSVDANNGRPSTKSQKDKIKQFVGSDGTCQNDRGMIDPFLRPPICVLVICVPMTVFFLYYQLNFPTAWPKTIPRKTALVMLAMNFIITLIALLWLHISNKERKKYQNPSSIRKDKPKELPQV